MDVIEYMTNLMSDEEYKKAVEFYKFLVNVTRCGKGILSIDRKKLIDVAAAYMGCSAIEAYTIIRKMHNYGWIKTLDKDYIIVNLEKEI